MTHLRFNKAKFRQMLQEKRATSLLVRLLRRLVQCSGIATSEDIQELLNQIREINDSVDFVARQSGRNSDGRRSAA